MKLFPFLGYRWLNQDCVYQLNLDVRYKWRSLEFEWLNRGMVFWVKAYDA